MSWVCPQQQSLPPLTASCRSSTPTGMTSLIFTSQLLKSGIEKRINRGTRAVKLCPFVDSHGSRERDQYQAISAQPECFDFSLEELRLADYENGEGILSNNLASSSTTSPILPLQRLPRSNSKKKNCHLDLYVLCQPSLRGKD